MPADGRWWSCRHPVPPKGSTRQASLAPACGSANPPAQAGGPAQRPRTASQAAAGPQADGWWRVRVAPPVQRRQTGRRVLARPNYNGAATVTLIRPDFDLNPGEPSVSPEQSPEQSAHAAEAIR